MKRSLSQLLLGALFLIISMGFSGCDLGQSGPETELPAADLTFSTSPHDVAKKITPPPTQAEIEAEPTLEVRETEQQNPTPPTQVEIEAEPTLEVRDTEQQNPTPLPVEKTTISTPLVQEHPITGIEMHTSDQPIFGVEMYYLNEKGGLNEIAAAGATYIRHNSPVKDEDVSTLIWTAVEPEKGNRNWNALSEMEKQLINAAERGMEVILIVRSTPLWARLDPNSPCGPIKPSEYDAFGLFMHDAVERYSASPYNVKYWELYNEPDFPKNTNKPSYGELHGCWGITGDTYFGGEAYGDMLKVVYPYIKSADSSAQVLVGGLLLDCDPRTVCTTGDASKPPKFLDGILSAGAGNSFDGVSFHAYDYFLARQDELGKYHNPNWGTSWNTTGPVLTAKADYISELLNKHGVTGKYLMNTESAILTYGDSTPAFEDTKSSYLVQAYAKALSVQKEYNFQANIWFHVFGWRHSGLLNWDRTPLPAYDAYDFAYDKLAFSTYVGDITEYGPNVKAYKFQHADRELWVVWSLDGANNPVTLPQPPSAIWDMYGNPQTITGTSFTVTLLPHYIEY